MFDDGYENITNIDISQTSIKAMNELYKEKGPNFKYIQMDVRAMEFAENSFDAVIDKGTFDSVVVSYHPNSVRRGLQHQRKQDVSRGVSRAWAKRCLHHDLLRQPLKSPRIPKTQGVLMGHLDP